MSENINSEEIQADEPVTEPVAEPAVEGVEESPAAVSAPVSADRPQRDSRPERTDRPPRSYSGGGDDQRYSKFKRKVCRFCADKSLPLEYKRTDILERFITDRGKILPRRVTGTCSKHQRGVAIAIKQARIIALLPFLEK